MQCPTASRTSGGSQRLLSKLSLFIPRAARGDIVSARRRYGGCSVTYKVAIGVATVQGYSPHAPRRKFLPTCRNYEPLMSEAAGATTHGEAAALSWSVGSTVSVVARTQRIPATISRSRLHHEAALRYTAEGLHETTNFGMDKRLTVLDIRIHAPIGYCLQSEAGTVWTALEPSSPFHCTSSSLRDQHPSKG